VEIGLKRIGFRGGCQVKRRTAHDFSANASNGIAQR
jgi:hypothetical protein